MRVSRSLPPLMALLLLPACSPARPVLHLPPDPRLEPVTVCEQPKGIPPQRLVSPKDVSASGQELHLRLDAKECPAQPIHVCWPGEILTSGNPQVEFFVFRDAGTQSCPEHRTEETRTYRTDSVRLEGLRDCRVEGSKVICFFQWR